jgi:hypothetical protein
VQFSDFAALPEQLRKKQPPTSHPPESILGNQRQKSSLAQPGEVLMAA